MNKTYSVHIFIHKQHCLDQFTAKNINLSHSPKTQTTARGFSKNSEKLGEITDQPNKGIAGWVLNVADWGQQLCKANIA